MNTFATIPKHVSHETIDGETIVINLDKGHYFSLQNTASLLWQEIASGHSLESIHSAFSNKNGNIVNDIEEFYEQLVEEGLITLSQNLETIEQERSFAIENYQKPVFQKFTDMEDLLLLDPIHDTDESGWPQTIK